MHIDIIMSATYAVTMRTPEFIAKSRAKRLHFAEDFVTCSRCSEPYDNKERVAKCLPCLHSFCKTCLADLVGKHTKFSCPKCCKHVTLPGATIDSLPNDYIVENMKEYHDISDEEAVCGNCDEHNEAVNFCQDCECFVCQVCVLGHQRMRSMRHHTLSPMADPHKKQHSPLMQQQVHCKKHPKQELILYCKEVKCKAAVCATCGLVDHRGHQLVDMSAGSEEVVTDIRNLSARLANRNRKLRRRKTLVEKAKQDLDTRFAIKERELHDQFQKLHDLLESQYTKASSQLKNLYDTETNRLAVSIESLGSLSVQMSSACEFVDKACDMSYPAQLLSSQHQLIKRLHELKIAKVPDGASKNIDFTFTNKHQGAMVQFQESLQNLYDIEWNEKQ